MEPNEQNKLINNRKIICIYFDKKLITNVGILEKIVMQMGKNIYTKMKYCSIICISKALVYNLTVCKY